ncbi:hypothetical protein O7632_22355 [Solwaraspora sp. WMMD406]|uniref:hypothetical protein n=1 Tax=Solwaraspora sp. WMMD406 TaxID=3016095 RepID=UPI002416221F|nr:hypothetical protein [Solwaraspora sp. WMMD406]MDG4766819.1 hypothetical protein [Solwaraspora sp. WMMD406]
MIVTCGGGGEPLEDKQILVCHHCGTPVCRAHGRIIAPDHAFADADADSAAPDGVDSPDPDSDTPNPVPHPVPLPARPTTAPSARGTAVSAPPAVHCEKCAKRFHPNEIRRERAANVKEQLKRFSGERSAGRP